jgi:hypothetical protein
MGSALRGDSCEAVLVDAMVSHHWGFFPLTLINLLHFATAMWEEQLLGHDGVYCLGSYEIIIFTSLTIKVKDIEKERHGMTLVLKPYKR